MPLVMPTVEGEPLIGVQSEGAKGLTAALIAGCLLACAIGITTPEIVFFVALVCVMLAEVISITEALSGFSNEGALTVGVLFLVVYAVEKSNVLDNFARHAFGTKSSVRVSLSRLYGVTFLLSGVFNNTPLVALFAPIARDWGRMRNIPTSQLLMPLNYAVLAGSMVSLSFTHSYVFTSSFCVWGPGTTHSRYVLVYGKRDPPPIILTPCTDDFLPLSFPSNQTAQCDWYLLQPCRAGISHRQGIRRVWLLRPCCCRYVLLLQIFVCVWIFAVKNLLVVPILCRYAAALDIEGR